MRFYASRLRGLPATDPTGERIGRVRDLVVALLPDAPPRLVGLVINVRRRPIFVGAGRVDEIGSAGVRLGSARVSLRRFEQRPGELLVLADLLDRTAVDGGSGRRVQINDVQLSSTDVGWEIVAAEVTPTGGRLRRGRPTSLPWSRLTGLAAAESAAGRAALLAGARPGELAEALLELPSRSRVDVFAALEDERAASALEELEEADAAALLATLPAERIGDVLDEMDADAAADLLGALPAESRSRLLALMEPEEAAPVQRLLSYAPDSAAGLMTVDEVVIVRPNASVAEGLARIREPELSPALASMVYVCEPPLEAPTGPFRGVAHFQALLRARPSDDIGSVLDRSLDPLTAELPAADVAAQLARTDLLSLPVCDAGGRLLGVVTVDDVLDHLLPRGWRSLPGTTDGGAP